jgi:hypothetical protein
MATPLTIFIALVVWHLGLLCKMNIHGLDISGSPGSVFGCLDDSLEWMLTVLCCIVSIDSHRIRG